MKKLNCRIKYSSDNNIEYIEDNKGNRSDLFDELRVLFGEEKALDFYAITETEGFKNYKDIMVDKIPTAKDIIEYNSITDEELTLEDKLSAIDSGFSNNHQLFFNLKKAFIDDLGLVIFDRNKMSRAGYNDYEITAILSRQDLQDSLKNNIFKVQNTPFFSNFDSNDNRYEKTDELNIFGKQKFRLKEGKEQKVSTIIDGKIVEKGSDTLQTLRKTYPLVIEPISDKLNKLFLTVNSLNEKVLNKGKNITNLKNVAKGIQKEVIKYGVDLRGIEDKVLPIARFKEFVLQLENYIINPNDDFSTYYDELFEPLNEVNPQIELNKNEIYLDTDLSEYELFRDYNLVRKKGNIYTKIKPEKLEDLYNYIEQVEIKEQTQAQDNSELISKIKEDMPNSTELENYSEDELGELIKKICKF